MTISIREAVWLFISAWDFIISAKGLPVGWVFCVCIKDGPSMCLSKQGVLACAGRGKDVGCSFMPSDSFVSITYWWYNLVASFMKPVCLYSLKPCPLTVMPESSS